MTTSYRDQIATDLDRLRDAGQKEYAQEAENAHANFERIADALDLEPATVLLTYAYKHIDGIRAWRDGHTSQREPVTGRLNDLMVYMALLYGMQCGARTRASVAKVLDGLVKLVPEGGSFDLFEAWGDLLASEYSGSYNQLAVRCVFNAAFLVRVSLLQEEETE